jgi:hypothetical protein
LCALGLGKEEGGGNVTLRSRRSRRGRRGGGAKGEVGRGGGGIKGGGERRREEEERGGGGEKEGKREEGGGGGGGRRGPRNLTFRQSKVAVSLNSYICFNLPSFQLPLLSPHYLLGVL